VDYPSTGSEPFNEPFFIALTQSSSTPLPATTEVDWVRAWAPAP